MMKTPIFSLSALVLAVLFFMTSCTQEDLLNTTDITSQDLSLSSDDSTKTKCFTLVFPVTIVFPDGSTQEFADEEALHTAKEEWKDSELYSKDSHPELQFPVTVTLADGTTSEIADEDAFHELRHACKGDKEGHGKGHGKGYGQLGKLFRDTSCVVVTFPVSIAYPEGTTVSYDDATTLLTEVKAWVTTNQDSISSTYRPELVFPITVTLSDGTTSEIADQDALKETIKGCRGSDDEHHGGKGKKGKKGKGH